MAAENDGSVVYVVQGNNRAGLKIGVTGNLEKRLYMLEREFNTKLTVLRTYPGTYALETYLHSQFKSAALGREWFDLTPERLADIDRLVADYALVEKDSSIESPISLQALLWPTEDAELLKWFKAKVGQEPPRKRKNTVVFREIFYQAMQREQEASNGASK